MLDQATRMGQGVRTGHWALGTGCADGFDGEALPLLWHRGGVEGLEVGGVDGTWVEAGGPLFGGFFG